MDTKAERRENRKRNARKMRVTGRSIFTIQRAEKNRLDKKAKK